MGLDSRLPRGGAIAAAAAVSEPLERFGRAVRRSCAARAGHPISIMEKQPGTVGKADRIHAVREGRDGNTSRLISVLGVWLVSHSVQHVAVVVPAIHAAAAAKLAKKSVPLASEENGAAAPRA